MTFAARPNRVADDDGEVLIGDGAVGDSGVDQATAGATSHWPLCAKRCGHSRAKSSSGIRFY